MQKMTHSCLGNITAGRLCNPNNNELKYLVHKGINSETGIFKANSRFVSVHNAMEVYWGNEGIAPRILDLRTRWRWVVNFTPQLLYPQGKSPWYPLDRRLGGPQSRFGRCGEERNSQPLPGLEAPACRPALYHWAIPAPSSKFENMIVCSKWVPSYLIYLTAVDVRLL
jgi:hypothetical protein